MIKTIGHTGCGFGGGFGISSRLTVVTTCSPLGKSLTEIYGLQLHEPPQEQLLILVDERILQEQEPRREKQQTCRIFSGLRLGTTLMSVSTRLRHFSLTIECFPL
jgi:hypothetical protein